MENYYIAHVCQVTKVYKEIGVYADNEQDVRPLALDLARKTLTFDPMSAKPEYVVVNVKPADWEEMLSRLRKSFLKESNDKNDFVDRLMGYIDNLSDKQLMQAYQSEFPEDKA
jgi:hypothetical protein